jgi:hypothetical protein
MNNTTLSPELLKTKDLPTALSSIRQKVMDYHLRMNDLSAQTPGSTLSRNLKNDFLQFYISKTDLASLVQMSNTGNAQMLAVFFGIDVIGGTEKLTACFLAVDDKGAIIPEHKDGTIPGEENWPPPPYDANLDLKNCFTLESNVNDIYTYFS